MMRSYSQLLLVLYALLVSANLLLGSDPKESLPPVGQQALTPKEVKELIKDYLKEEEKKEKEEAKEKAKEKEEEEKKAAEKGSVVGSDLALKASWRNGLRLRTSDGAFRVHVGGRIHSDFTWWNTEDQVENGVGGVGPLEDGARFRRARIRVNGRMYETVRWLMEYGFENGVPQFFDVYGEIAPLPYLGHIRIGHFREPFSMDALTQGNELTFVERSLIQDPFVPFRNMGILFHDAICNKHATWALGGFRSASDGVAGDAGDRNYAVTGRFTLNPWYGDEGRGALHFGIAGSYRHNPLRNAAGAIVSRGGLPRARFSTFPEERVNAPRFADTGFLIVDNHQLLGTEMAFAVGSFILQSEYVVAFVPNASIPGSTVTGANAIFHGGYVQVSYFLTGEHRPYSQSNGTFVNAIPFENFFCVRGDDCNKILGWGAWEVGARYSHLNLSSAGIQGGILNHFTVGMNWYLNQTCRFMCNYILSWRDARGVTSDGLTRILAARFQVDF